MQALIGLEGCGVSHLLSLIRHPMPRMCGAARPNRVQLIVNFVTISLEPFAVAVPAADVNAFGALYAARLEDAEGFLVCYHANVARSLQAATRLIKELIAVKRTGGPACQQCFFNYYTIHSRRVPRTYQFAPHLTLLASISLSVLPLRAIPSCALRAERRLFGNRFARRWQAHVCLGRRRGRPDRASSLGLHRPLH